MSFADNLCIQIGIRSDPTERLVSSRSKMEDTLIVFLFFLKFYFEKKVST